MTPAAITSSHAQGDAAHGPYKVNSLVLGADANPLEGSVRWDPARSLWNGGMLLASIVLAPLFFSWRRSACASCCCCSPCARVIRSAFIDA